MNEWQPIETAPKDGTAILIYSSARGAFTAYRFRGRWWLLEGRSWLAKPTHWMPLPEHPSHD